MASTTLSRVGQINTAGTTDALFLKKFSGEVYTIFEAANTVMDKHMVRTIENGRSAQFPVIGVASTHYMTPGEDLLETPSALNTFAKGERTIAIDALLTSNTIIYRLDEAKSHFDVRSEYAKQMGIALGNELDKHVYQVLALAARTAASDIFTGSPGGTTVTIAGETRPLTKDDTWTISDFIDGVYAAAQSLDEANVPKEGRYIAIQPYIFYKLVQQTDLINRDWNMGNGDYAKAEIYHIAGFQIVVTNNAPFRQNLSAYNANIPGGGSPTVTAYNDYAVDLRKTLAICWLAPAVGTLKLMDLKMEMEYQMRFKGHWVSGDLAVGHGVLRPECAVEIEATTTTIV